jgi:hypothetical protein
MPLSSSDFRQRYPAFGDTVKYPPGSVELYIELAYDALNKRRFTDKWLDFAAGLYTAHMLTLDGAQGGAQGADSLSGLVQSANVDSVSVTFDTASVVDMNAGHWNETTYGRRYYRLLRMFGAGPVHVLPRGQPRVPGFHHG